MHDSLLHSGTEDRLYWIGVTRQLAMPILTHLADGTFREALTAGMRPDRAAFAPLEAFSRLLAGIAPFLEHPCDHPAEETVRRHMVNLTQAGIRAAVDPSSTQHMNFEHGLQPIVDLAFLAQAMLRAPQTLWESLDDTTRDHLLIAFTCQRDRKPNFSNWLLFSAMIEAALRRFSGRYDPMRVDYALRKHMEWYLGDGAYGDGPEFHWDYYNSFVIQPMMLEILEEVSPDDPQWSAWLPRVRQRCQRWAAILERLISPEGTIPPLGRSLAYRYGALGSLAQSAYRRQLPDPLTPGSVRAAMTAVIRRMHEAPGAFDGQGWLTVGFCGNQPRIAESYISRASAYLCSIGLLPLGLPASDPFWSEPPQWWTSARLWNGEDLPADKAHKE